MTSAVSRTSSKKSTALSLPAEFTRDVFLRTFSSADRQCGYSHVRRVRATVQFRIAAVCQSWRTIALKMPSLWSDIVIYLTDMKVVDEQLPYVRTLLQRSRGTPLDIFLYGSWRPPKGWIGDVQEEFFFLLESTASRWRTLHIDATMSHLTSSCIAMFAFETPLLEDLMLSLKYHGYAKPTQPRKFEYLPYCPRLRKLCVRDTGLATIFPFPYANRGPLNSLQVVFFDGAWIAPETVWALLPLMSNVVDLRISYFGVDWRGDVEAPKFRICLPNLKALTVTAPPKNLPQLWAPMLDLPNLTELGVFHLEDTSQLQALVQMSRVSDTVTSFWFGGEDNPKRIDIPILATLANVRHLTLLDEPVALRTLCQAMEAGSLWPDLQVLRIGDMRLDGDEFGPPDADTRAASRALLSFVKARAPQFNKLILSSTNIPWGTMNKLYSLVSVDTELELPE